MRDFEALPVLNAHPGLAFGFNWDLDNVNAFVAAANAPDSALQAPPPAWLRTPPPHMTANSFTDDVVQELSNVAGGDNVSCGRGLLVPNTLAQFVAVGTTLIALQDDEFLQAVAQRALPPVNSVVPYLATTYNLTGTRTQRATPNNLVPARRNGQPLRQLFI